MDTKRSKGKRMKNLLINQSSVLYFFIVLVFCVGISSCEEIEAEAEFSIPKYIKSLNPLRYEDEIAFRKKFGRWSQRAVLGMISFNILGTLDAIDYYDDIDDEIGVFKHPVTGEFENFYVKDNVLDWELSDDEFETDLESLCDLEGIGCGAQYYKREFKKCTMDASDDGSGMKCQDLLEDIETPDCWCIPPLHLQIYEFPSDSDSEDQACLDHCGSKDMLAKCKYPINAITHIDLSGLQLVGTMLPEEVSDLLFLDSLLIDDNRLIGSLKLKNLGLRHLNISGNELMDFSLDRLPRLQSLVMANTKLESSVPASFTDLPMLAHVDLSGNKIQGTIPTFVGMDKLQHLNLSDNRFTGEITVELLQMPELTLLDLSNNQLSKFPQDDFPIKNFQSIILSNNTLDGAIPSNLFQDQLKIFRATNNKLSGTIPVEIESAKSLTQFDVSFNDMTGTIPKVIYDLAHLEELGIVANKFRGQISHSLYKSKLVKDHDSESNPPRKNMLVCPRGYFHWQGKATTTEDCRVCAPCEEDLKEKECLYLGQTTCSDGSKVVRGDMNGNGFVDEREVLFIIYQTADGHLWNKHYRVWGDLKNHPDACKGMPGIECSPEGFLESIRIPDVGLNSGDEEIEENFMGLPPEIGHLRQLRTLELSGNYLFELPPEMSKLENLKYLMLDRCNLVSLPPALWTLKKLESVDLSQNKLSGNIIPPEIGNLTYLKEFKIASSDVDGKIPSEIGNVHSLVTLDLSKNNMHGTLPQSMGNLQNLKEIHLESNFFSGPIDHIFRLRRMEVINLKSNNFYGAIPSQLAPRVQHLDLYDNLFFGDVPHFLNSQMLTSLRLGDNRVFQLPPELCRGGRKINGGPIGSGLGPCDHILCPVGSHSMSGHAPCTLCREGLTNLFPGSISCDNLYDDDILEPFLSLVYAQDEYPPEDYDKIDICTSWKGIECDKQKKILSIEVPLANIDIDKVFN